MNAKFDALLKLEDEIRIAVALSEFGVDADTRGRGIDAKVRIAGELIRQVMEMTKDEQSAYGDYRMAAKRCEEITMSLPSN